jgi:hypothetical protein
MSAPAKPARVFVLCAAALCGACSGIPNTTSSNLIIPNETLNISRSVSIPAESIAGGILLYLIVDPLAPNWQIEESPLDGGRYRIALKKKRFTTGGDGEAVQIFYRRAAQIAVEQGGRYRVVEYSEGIDSSVPIAQRVAQGVVELVRQTPDKP